MRAGARGHMNYPGCMNGTDRTDNICFGAAVHVHFVEVRGVLGGSDSAFESRVINTVTSRHVRASRILRAQYSWRGGGRGVQYRGERGETGETGERSERGRLERDMGGRRRVRGEMGVVREVLFGYGPGGLRTRHEMTLHTSNFA